MLATCNNGHINHCYTRKNKVEQLWTDQQKCRLPTCLGHFWLSLGCVIFLWLLCWTKVTRNKHFEKSSFYAAKILQILPVTSHIKDKKHRGLVYGFSTSFFLVLPVTNFASPHSSVIKGKTVVIGKIMVLPFKSVI